MKELTNIEIQQKALTLASMITLDLNLNLNKIGEYQLKIYGVPRGGIPTAYILSRFIQQSVVVDDPEEADIIVDDIIDSSETKHRYTLQYNKPFYSLYDKQKDWIHFPWERKDENTPILDNILRIEQFLESSDQKESKRILKLLNKVIKHYK